MLAVSPLTYNNIKDDQRDNEIECFPDFADGNLLDLDSIDFDELFMGINDGDVLPDLEMDSEILAEFSVSSGDESDMNNNYNIVTTPEDNSSRKYEVEKAPSDLTSLNKGEECVSEKNEEPGSINVKTKSKENNDKGKKSSGQSKKPEGKRKVKVDWTPELHRRFVQAVEQLGLDKAVPSRILELMGIDGLTRHNIASHLQKYRSHRKHLLAREAEAASWNQRRQIYGGAAAGAGGKRDINPWPAPTMGFPPMTPPPMPHFRPLHVWGHPSHDQSRMQVWPKQPAPPAWAAPPVVPPHPLSPTEPSFWHSHHQRVSNCLAPGTPCFPAPIAPTRFPVLPVPGIPPAAMIKAASTGAGLDLPKPPCDFHPSKENIDAAIEDVLAKPCLPLPLGLKPPSIDSVLKELQRQGITKVPPTVSGS